MDMIRLNDLDKSQIFELFSLADELAGGKYNDMLRGKTIVMFFPASSIRTRITFEKGIYLLGAQCVLFPSETLDKKEDIRDVCGYLDNWADAVIVRHKNISLLDKMAENLTVPVINAMTDVNHPCEIITDLYSLTKRGRDICHEKYLFVGNKGNIGLGWKEASDVLGFELSQCCGKGCEIDGLHAYYDIMDAVKGKDIICTDALSADVLSDFRACQVTKTAMDHANSGAVLNPCPPFYRGEEVSADAIDSEYFVGYDFKKCLLEVQQAVLWYCMNR